MTGLLPPPPTGAMVLLLRLDDPAAVRTPGLSLDPMVRPFAEPEFAGMVRDWGCPLVGVPWTGRRPEQLPEGNVVPSPATSMSPRAARPLRSAS